MTCAADGEDDAVVPELRLRIADERCEWTGYIKLPQGNDLCSEVRGHYGLVSVASADEKEDPLLATVEPPTPKTTGCGCLWKWAKFALLLTFLGVLAGVFIMWIGPFLMDKEIIPIINWERSTFSTPLLAVILFLSVAFFPSLLLPSSPSMWVAGMTFGYGYGFLLIMSAVAIGVSLPFFIGSLFHRKIQGCLEKYPKRASIVRLAGEGDWMNQFQAVVLIRVSPFPYIIYNYCSVATNVRYGPYFLGSMVGMIPDVLVAIYTGILIRTLADASHEHHFLSAQEIIFDVLGFAATVTTTVICTISAKKRLKKIQMEEEATQPMLLQ